MHLTHLALTDFRNFARLDLSLPRKTLLLTGRNAQGKTSLLEAVYLLSTLTSFQTSAIWQMVNFLAARQPLAVARLVGEYQRSDGPHRLELRLILESNGAAGRSLRREALLDGLKKPLHQIVGHFKAVLFVPQMTQVIEGGPELRRRYLDLALAQVYPAYTQTLSEYRQTLSQRNALLKMLAERRGDPAQLAYWDELLAEKGAWLMHWRIQALDELERQAARVQHALTDGDEVLRLAYQPAYEPLPQPERQIGLPLDTPVDRSSLTAADIAAGFRAALQKLRPEEIARGVTTIGPHRDDFRLLANGIDLGHYGSRGQIRTALLALKMAEVDWIQARTGEWPVILLDEVLSELDQTRRGALLQHLLSRGQVFITSTDAAVFPADFRAQAVSWVVENGIVSPLSQEVSP